VKQKKLGDYPSEKVKRSPNEKMVRPPRRKRKIKIVNYKPKHRADAPAVVTPEQMEGLRNLKRRGIEYHREKMKQ